MSGAKREKRVGSRSGASLGQLLGVLQRMGDRRTTKLKRLADSVFSGPGTVEPQVRHAAAAGSDVPTAWAPYVEKIRHQAYKVSDGDVAALREAGYSEDQIFEVTISVALSAGLLRLQAGLRAHQGGE